MLASLHNSSGSNNNNNITIWTIILPIYPMKRRNEMGMRMNRGIEKDDDDGYKL